jgi:hypothetical protein
MKIVAESLFEANILKGPSEEEVLNVHRKWNEQLLNKNAMDFSDGHWTEDNWDIEFNTVDSCTGWLDTISDDEERKGEFSEQYRSYEAAMKAAEGNRYHVSTMGERPEAILTIGFYGDIVEDVGKFNFELAYLLKDRRWSAEKFSEIIMGTMDQVADEEYPEYEEYASFVSGGGSDISLIDFMVHQYKDKLSAEDPYMVANAISMWYKDNM